MIHNTFLIRISTKEVLASTKYWPVDVAPEVLSEYVTTREELRSADSNDTDLSELALIVGDHKFHGVDLVSDVLLLFVTDKGEDEASIFEKVESASKDMRKELAKSGLDAVKENYEKLLEPSVTTRLKIALVGEGGVGKTTTLHLLLGETPPLQYVPTIALNLETVENIRFGNYSLVLWDFAGQERFRTLWRFYFHGADVIFLVCDSALRNVIISKDILKLIKRDAPKVPVFALANKQDKPNAMKPEVVQKILGIPTYPMVAIDKARRDEMLRILMTAAAQYVGVALPDLPASELLKFTDAATKEAIAETDAMEERREAQEIEAAAEADEYETIEVVEEVLVDEEGHIIENMEDYEVVEEVIEEVEDIFEEELEEEVVSPEPPAEVMIEDLEEAEAEVDVSVSEPEKEEAVETPEQPTEVMIEDLEEAEAEVDVSVSEPEKEEAVETPEQPTEVMIEDLGESEAEVEVSVSESELEEIETFPLEAEVSEEHIIHREIELAEADISQAEAKQVDDEAFEIPQVEEMEVSGETSMDIPIDRSEEPPSIEAEESPPSIGFVEEELPPEEVLGIEPVLEQNNGDVKLAKEIIFEALEADEFISAELDLVSHAEIDEALEAFKSDEAVPAHGESDIREEIDAESLEELELILGPLDSAVGGTKKKESVVEERHSENSPINNESLDELSRLLDFVDSGEDEE
ncbi:MAG: ADP-ribosylation factor-like protein [Candidatus Thorarchaeota archaeon]